jgi:hypothetical protein
MFCSFMYRLRKLPERGDQQRRTFRTLPMNSLCMTQSSDVLDFGTWHSASRGKNQIVFLCAAKVDDVPSVSLPAYSQLTKELCVKAVRWLGHSHHIAVLVMAAPHQFGHNELPFHRSVHRPCNMTVAALYSEVVL